MRVHVTCGVTCTMLSDELATLKFKPVACSLLTLMASKPTAKAKGTAIVKVRKFDGRDFEAIQALLEELKYDRLCLSCWAECLVDAKYLDK